jgi:hypothetical protein
MTTQIIPAHLVGKYRMTPEHAAELVLAVRALLAPGHMMHNDL